VRGRLGVRSKAEEVSDWPPLIQRRSINRYQ